MSLRIWFHVSAFPFLLSYMSDIQRATTVRSDKCKLKSTNLPQNIPRTFIGLHEITEVRNQKFVQLAISFGFLNGRSM